MNELNEISEQWLAEHWLLSAGVVSETSLNTLVLYGYSHPSVQKVVIEIDQDEAHQGENPRVTYKVSLKPTDYIKWKAIQKAKTIKNSLLQKAALLALASSGAPLDLEEQIINRASEYLPKKFLVEVKILE